MKTARLFVGSFTGKGAQGISAARFDPEAGTFEEPSLAARAENPAFLARHPRLPLLYAVNEIGGEGGGFVSAFAVEPAGLRRMARVAAGGKSPCHLEVDASGRMLAVAHYGGPGVASFHLDEHGAPRPVSNLAQEGSSIHPTRQKVSHPHAAHFAPHGCEVFVPNLGADRIFIYRADPILGLLEFASSLAVAPGSGPRHLVFHGDGTVMFVAHELAKAVEVFRREERGWVSTQRVSTLPTGFTGESTVAEIALHPGGKFLYVSNRGADTVAVFRVDADGTLTVAGQFACGGRTPRHFAIHPTGRWLVAANQESNTLVIFAVDPASGALAAHGHPVETPAPACVLFVEG